MTHIKPDLLALGSWCCSSQPAETLPPRPQGVGAIVRAEEMAEVQVASYRIMPAVMQFMQQTYD